MRAYLHTPDARQMNIERSMNSVDMIRHWVNPTQNSFHFSFWIRRLNGCMCWAGAYDLYYLDPIYTSKWAINLYNSMFKMCLCHARHCKRAIWKVKSKRTFANQLNLMWISVCHFKIQCNWLATYDECHFDEEIWFYEKGNDVGPSIDSNESLAYANLWNGPKY